MSAKDRQAALDKIPSCFAIMWRHARDAGVPFEDFLNACVLALGTARAKRRGCGTLIQTMPPQFEEAAHARR